ncbi:NUDIX hydrolase [Brachybacterium subflavum]|uniref:NUDIX hydrolase n=1 Tax=Brachybacterium subflavum TaxID=2585206 RepID=UPI001D0D0DC6|nr:NUDIX domain-containing protein [Brachybacterium subflavum]
MLPDDPMLADVLRALEAVPAHDASPALAARDNYLTFVHEHGGSALWKGLAPEHVTASTFVLSPDGAQVLLCFHRKGGFWVQVGGHLEREDASLADAALREAREESGLEHLALATDAITDLDRHELAGAFTCRAHWDIGFTAVADPRERIVVSEESRDVRWFPVDSLPSGLAPGCARRIRAAREVLR